MFLDRDLRDGIALGEEWARRLHEELRRADAVVCVVTSDFLASRWCTAEVAIAQSRGIRVLPLRAEAGVADPLLTSVQHSDLTTNTDVTRATLVEALHQVDTLVEAARQTDNSWSEDRSPFPGLRPFEADQHRVFFGRTQEVRQLAELLRSPAERAEGAALLVVGPSGCGKSSLVRAGLLPVMAGEPGWRVLPPILPGADPVAALARELAATARRLTLDWTVKHVRQQLDEHGLTDLTDELLLADPGPQQRLLIVVDQFEELLTQAPPAQRTQFAKLLRTALAGPVGVVATLRPEFLDQLLLDPDLAALCTRSYILRPLRRAALRAVIEQPAQLAGIEMDDDLVDRLIEDTDTGEALPLLAFTLAQLADGVTRGGRLSHARYKQLRGVQGALTDQADAALKDAIAAGGRSREQVIAGLLRLVTVDEQGRPTRWRINRTELSDHVFTELNAFVARRLLTTDSDNGIVVIGVAHEAFLSAWPPLAQAIAQNVSALRARRAVEHAATEWHDNTRPSDRLWTGGQLAAAVTDTGARSHPGQAPADTPPTHRLSRWVPRRRQVLVTHRVTLSPQAHDFLYASIRHDRRRRRRATTVLSVLLILALTAAGIAVVQQRKAEDRRLVATARQLIAQAESARDTDPRIAMQLAIAANHIHPDGETHASLVNSLTTTRYISTLTSDKGDVKSFAFSPARHLLATAGFDQSVILWDLSNPVQPRRLGPPLTNQSEGSSVAISPDGRILAIAGIGQTVILWDLANPAQPRRLGQPLSVQGTWYPFVAFSPDGAILATGSNDGAVILWDLANPAQPQPRGESLTGHATEVRSGAFSADGRMLVTASGGEIILWDLTDPAQPRRLGQPLDGLSGWNVWLPFVAISPDGKILATASRDFTVILWDLTDPAQPRRLGQTPVGGVNSVAFAPDGAALVTGMGDGTVLLWDLTDPSQPQPLGQPLIGHRNVSIHGLGCGVTPL